MKNNEFLIALRDLIFDFLADEEERIDWLISRGWEPRFRLDEGNVNRLICLVHPSIPKEELTLEAAIFQEAIVLTETSGITNICGETIRFMKSKEAYKN